MGRKTKLKYRDRPLLCPWCGESSDAPIAWRKKFKAGTAETRRLMKKGRVHTISRPYNGPRNRVQLIMCAHVCHVN